MKKARQVALDLEEIGREYDYSDVVHEVENEEDSTLVSPDLLDGVVVTDSDWTAETIINQLAKGNILLNPRFQRRDAWDDKRKSKFIESLLLGIPVPQLVLAEVPGSKGKYLVIDGKQRLLALMRFASDAANPLKLKNLTIRNDLNGQGWADICGNPASEDDASFENAQIRTTFIRGWRDERVLYLIFHRLNSGSVPLSPQELRHVLHPGEFIDFAFDFSGQSKVLISILGRKGKPDFRMRDVEMLIRFFGFNYFLSTYTGDLKAFLDETVKMLNLKWSTQHSDIVKRAHQCELAIETTVEIFGEFAFSKWSRKGYERRFNRAVFDVMTYYFSDEIVRKNALAKSEEVVNGFIELCEFDEQFLRSLETTTKSKEATFSRLKKWGRTLEKILDTPIKRVNDIKDWI